MKDSIRDLIDAGPLVAFLSEADQWHRWAVDTLAVIDEPVATSETTLAEACHLLKIDRAGLLRVISFVGTGASQVVLSEQFRRAKIITVDVRDFTMYRRFRDKPLPVIHP